MVKRYDEGGYGLSDMEESADGSWVDYESHLMVVMGMEQLFNDKIAALQQERDAMAAENAALKSFITKNCFVEDDSSDYGFADASISMPSAPASDAYLNSVRAEGADAVAAYHKDRAEALIAIDRKGANDHKVSYMAAKDVADQLRSGTHDTADKAG